MSPAPLLPGDPAFLDRLVEALLLPIEPGRPLRGRVLALERDSAVVVLSDRAETALIVTVPPGGGEALEPALKAKLEDWKAGELHVVVLGGGLEVKGVAQRLTPFWKLNKQLAVHQIDATGHLHTHAGQPLPLLQQALEQVRAGPPQAGWALENGDLHHRLQLIQETAQLEVAKDVAFVQQLKRARTPATVAIVAICVGMFALEALWGAVRDTPMLLRMGAGQGNLLREGQWWRALSPAVLHYDLLHVFLNMVALLSFGPLMERVLGTRRFLILYVLSALGGALASAAIHANVVSVGASGALWGLMTAGGGLALRPSGILPPLAVERLRRGVGQPVVVNLVISFLPGIDLMAHLGGGVVGLLLLGTGVLTRGAVPVERRALTPERPSLALRGVTVLLVGGLVASVAMALWQGRPWRGNVPDAPARVALGDSGLSAEVSPSMTAQRAHALEGGTVLQFGRDLGEVPVLLLVEVRSTSDYPGMEGMAPEQVIERLRTQLSRESLGGLRRKGHIRVETIAGRPTTVDTLSSTESRAEGEEGAALQEWGTFVAGKLVLVTAVARPNAPAAWQGLGETLVTSLKKD